MKLSALLVLSTTCLQLSMAQPLFPEQCLGIWKGTLYIHKLGAAMDSVQVQLTVEATADPNAWTWKTEYLSSRAPVVKDYVLRLKDAAAGVYAVDEGAGLELLEYRFGNKLYCVFETAGIMLTSSYELRGDELIFEVTAGEKQPASHKEVTNYSVANLQRVQFRRAR